MNVPTLVIQRTIKKGPTADAGGLLNIWRRIYSAAAAGTATAAAATAATTRHRNEGRDGETGTHSAFYKVNLDATAILHQVIVDEEGETFFLYLEIAIFWLIQSQAQ